MEEMFARVDESKSGTIAFPAFARMMELVEQTSSLRAKKRNSRNAGENGLIGTEASVSLARHAALRVLRGPPVQISP